MHIKMKGGSWNSLRGKQFLLTIFALVCTSIFLWAWEKTPFVSTLLPQQDQFKVLSPVSLKHKLDVEVDSPDAVEEQEETTNQRGPDFDKQKTGVEEHFSDAAEGRESKNRQPEHISDEDKKGEEEVSSLPAERRDTRTVEPSQGVGGAEIDSMNVSTSEKRKGDEDLTKSPMEKKGCNYAKGKWVPDSKRPLYSGFGCKQWLSEMWACRLTQRPDFSFEGFRWQPQYCEMPEFEGYSFLRKMQDKTLAFIGDSLGRQQFQSLMCMITGGKEYKEVEDVGRDYGLVKARGAVRPDGWAYRFPRTNTTILYYWSASLCKLEPLNITNPLTEYAMHLDQPVTFLSKYLHNFDVLVLNTGHHWNRGKISANRWVMHVNGQPTKDRAISQIGNAKNLTIYSVVKWLDSQLPNHPRLKAFFRTISPRHFVNGDWNSGGSCDNPVPLAGGSEVSQEESSDLLVSGAVKGTRAKLLDITALSQLRDECHISKYSVKGTQGAQDCLHWCLPGVPDTWNEILSAQI